MGSGYEDRKKLADLKDVEWIKLEYIEKVIWVHPEVDWTTIPWEGIQEMEWVVLRRMFGFYLLSWPLEHPTGSINKQLDINPELKTAHWK